MRSDVEVRLPPGETAHWTSRAMAGAMGLAISTVQKIWHAHGLAPHLAARSDHAADADIDDVRVYRTALDAAQIGRLYRAFLSKGGEGNRVRPHCPPLNG